ncbi:hypothetical protein, partial [Pseudoalteromonas sp. S1649]|uniref:hypothetical protein n=1 Tax=Pseudoalteromonas sp. S1649 TaxID=579508 RepID=UPI00126A822E
KELQPNLPAIQVSTQLRARLVSGLSMAGQDTVKAVLELSLLLNPGFDYYLYRYAFNGDLSLV